MSLCPPSSAVDDAAAVSESPAGAARSATTWQLGGALVAVASLSAALGLFRLGRPSIWFDESATWQSVARDWRAFWTAAVSGEDCGGFVYTLLVKFWTAAAGYDEVALRLPSTALAVGLTAVLFKIGYDLRGLKCAVLTALCGALHPAVVCWSRQARGYSLLLFLTALYLASLTTYVRRGGRHRAVLAALIGTVLCLTHVFGVFVAAGGGLFLLLQRISPRSTDINRPSLAPAVVPGLAAACWLFLMQARIKHNLNEFWIGGSWADGYLSTAHMLIPCFKITIFALAAGLGLTAYRSRTRDERRLLTAVACLLLAVLAGPAAASALSRGPHHFILARYFLPGVVPVVVLLGYFASYLPLRWALPSVLALGLAGLAADDARRYYGDAAYDGSCSRAAAAALAGRVRPGDRVLVSPSYEMFPLMYYGLHGDAVRGVGFFGRRQPLVDLLRREPTPMGRRDWLLVYHPLNDEDLRALGAEHAPRKFFGTTQVICLEHKPPPTKSAGE